MKLWSMKFEEHSGDSYLFPRMFSTQEAVESFFQDVNSSSYKSIKVVSVEFSLEALIADLLFHIPSLGNFLGSFIEDESAQTVEKIIK